MSQVRALAFQFARGRISRDDYRKQRAELVRRITAGELELEYAQPRPPESTGQGRRDETEFLLDMGDEVFGEPAAASGRKGLLVGAAVVVVLALAAGGWWLLAPQFSTPAADSAAQETQPPGEALLADFLDDDDWTPTALDALEMEWKLLDANERAVARDSLYWRRFRSRLRERINEQQTLANYDESGIAADTAQRLQALQDALDDQDLRE